MARKSGIWWHESRQCWYTSHGGKNQRLDPNKKASSTEFVGEFWLRKLAKCVI